MTIRLKQQQLEEILAYAHAGLPNESCGLLGGRIDGEVKTVEKVYLLKNMDQSPEHFTMDPKEQFAAIKDMRGQEWVLLGNFHSHPSTPSRPSQEDIRLAFDPNASYLILSLEKEGQPVLKSFNIKNSQVTEEELRII